MDEFERRELRILGFQLTGIVLAGLLVFPTLAAAFTLHDAFQKATASQGQMDAALRSAGCGIHETTEPPICTGIRQKWAGKTNPFSIFRQKIEALDL